MMQDTRPIPALPPSSPPLEEALHAATQSEARFRMLFALSSDWYWEQDAELRFVETVARTDDRAGLHAMAHIGKRRWELPGTEPLGTTWVQHQVQLAAKHCSHF